MLATTTSKTIRAADLFCGAGGSSTGALAACRDLGLSLDLTAVNHWPTAIETHRASHPHAAHYCEDLAALDPIRAVPGGHLHLLVASPECTHHSNARGGKPMQAQSRASAWHILRWTAILRIDNVLVENVPEWEHWCALGEDGRPLKSQRGRIFRAWIAAFRAQDYRVEWRVLNAADYGDATTRKRLFVIARRGRRKIVWPEPSHAPRAEADLFTARPRWRAAREIIDWTLEGKSIFGRKKPLSPNTMRRIIAGLRRFGGPGLEPFIVQLNGTDAKRNIPYSSRSVDDPLFTVTGGNHSYLAEPFVLPNEGIHRGNAPRSVDEPLPTATASHGCGHLVQPFVIGQQSCAAPRAVTEPLPTVAGAGAIAVVQPFIVGAGGPSHAGEPQTTERPLGTVLTRESRAVVQSFVIQTDQTGSNGHCSRSTEEPLATAVSKQNSALIEPFLVPFFGERAGQTPRTHGTNEPLPAVTGQGAGELVEPYLVEFHGNHAGRNDGDQRTRSLEDPLPTQTCDARFGLAQPFVMAVTHAGADASRCRPVDELVSTITGAHRGEHALVEPHLVKFYGTGSAASVDDPLDTITAKDRFALVQPTVRTADGQTLALDIRFRMLQPHELAAAMSFPPGYRFAGNREAQVKQIGNAVAVQVSKALIRSLLEN